jgi:hypothetical protein
MAKIPPSPVPRVRSLKETARELAKRKQAAGSVTPVTIVQRGQGARAFRVGPRGAFGPFAVERVPVPKRKKKKKGKTK